MAKLIYNKIKRSLFFMKYFFFFSLLGLLLNDNIKALSKNSKNQDIKRLKCLLKAYPDFFCSFKETKLKSCDGKIWDFYGKKSHDNYQSKLNFPSLKDQMELSYPKGLNFTLPFPENFDPGRIRYEPLFRSIYGTTAKEVRKNLVTVKWLPSFTKKKLRVTKINGVNKKIEAISSAIEKLPYKIRRVVYNPMGTFNWRYIKGTKRLSTHSFGIAIDLVSPTAKNYWKFSSPNKNKKYHYKNTFPLEIVEIFEKHGFIWGGKWYHFDGLHFEYRPELLVEGCFKSNSL